MKSVASFIFFLGAFFIIGGAANISDPLPAIVEGSGFAFTPTAYAASTDYPSRLSIPSIKLAASVAPVGVDPDGAMSVPVAPNTVGWYKNGTVPGKTGSAVLDAHVYLAFRDLKKVKVGDSIYVTGQSGKLSKFVVSGIGKYRYTNVPLGDLFTMNDAARLNLITCAGKWLPSKGTYDHRLIVYAKLAG